MNAKAPRRRSLLAAVSVAAVFGLPFVLPVLAQDVPFDPRPDLANDPRLPPHALPAPSGEGPLPQVSLPDAGAPLVPAAVENAMPRLPADVLRRAGRVAFRESSDDQEVLRRFTAEVRIAQRAMNGFPPPGTGSLPEADVPGIPVLSPEETRLLEQLAPTDFAENFARLIQERVEAPDVDISLDWKVFEGRPVREGEFTEVVALGPGPSTYRCSGILLGPRLVLTAGHCEENGNYRWIFVGNDATALPQLRQDSNADYREYGVYRALPDPLRHPEYRRDVLRDRIENDLMLVVLRNPVRREIPPVRLASAEMFDDNLDFVSGVGFGTSDRGDRSGLGVKREGILILASEVCEDTHTVSFGCNAGYEFVAGNHLQNSDSSSLCSADSGAPVFISEEMGDTFLAGINSRATRQHQIAMTRCGVASNITRLDAFADDWLRPACKQLAAQYGLDRETISLLNRAATDRHPGGASSSESGESDTDAGPHAGPDEGGGDRRVRPDFHPRS